MQCFKTLIEMPCFTQLSVSMVKPTREETAAVTSHCGAGKEPLSLSFSAVTLPQMAALPLEHCSDVWAKLMVLPAGLTQQQLANEMHQALQNASRCKEVAVNAVVMQGEEPAPGGFLSSFMDSSCPLKVKGHSLMLRNLALEADDIHGVASAWGPSIRHLHLRRCSLSAPAWSALASGTLSALAVLTLQDARDPHLLAAHLVVLALRWPSDRRLTVQVTGDEGRQLASTCTDAMKRYKCTNVQFMADAATPARPALSTGSAASCSSRVTTTGHAPLNTL
jgi:hypothetical protein